MCLLSNCRSTLKAKNLLLLLLRVDKFWKDFLIYKYTGNYRSCTPCKNGEKHGGVAIHLKVRIKSSFQPWICLLNSALCFILSTHFSADIQLHFLQLWSQVLIHLCKPRELSPLCFLHTLGRWPIPILDFLQCCLLVSVKLAIWIFTTSKHFTAVFE